MFFTANHNGSCSKYILICFHYVNIDHSVKKFVCSFPVDRGMLELKMTTDYGKSFKTIANKIFSFGLGGKFLFASVMTGKVSVQLCIIGYQGQNSPCFDLSGLLDLKLCDIVLICTFL